LNPEKKNPAKIVAEVDMQNYQALRNNLNERYSVLRERLSRINGDLRHVNKPLDADSQEQATELENDEVLQALEKSMREEIGLIEKTISRIDAGEYGICESCGEEISEKRLEALPHTNLCVSCAEKAVD
jgi:RNA polymerase-binding protein DksA